MLIMRMVNTRSEAVKIVLVTGVEKHLLKSLFHKVEVRRKKLSAWNFFIFLLLSFVFLILE